MFPIKKDKKEIELSGILLPLLVALFNTLLIVFPTEVIGAAKEGTMLWYNSVFPSLLPFIIGTNLLSGLGLIHFAGTILEPVMYPLFRVPGCGGFALIAGMTSGYPMGAKITGQLRETGQLSQAEAQRLISFCNTSGPLFIVGAVGVGMFGSAEAGYFMLIIHYAGAFLTGLVFRNYRAGGNRAAPSKKRLIRQAFRSMSNARRSDGRSFGKLLGDSVRNALEAVTQVGGFIILFCVLVRILEVTNILGLICAIMEPAISFIHTNIHSAASAELFEGLLAGLLEMTNGVKMIAADASSPISSIHIVVAAALISFGGFSIHAQSVNFISKTDIKISAYIFSKITHGLITIIMGALLCPFFNFERSETVTVYNPTDFTGTLFYSSARFMLITAIILSSCVILLINGSLRRRR